MKSDCIFCKIIEREIESEIIYENKKIIAFLDIDPINEGHVLIVPKDHILDIDEIPISLINEMMVVARKIVILLKKTYKPDGYSIMQNGGEFNEIGHFHLHVFPRYNGDGFGWTSSDKNFDTSSKISNKIKEKLGIIIED